MSVKHGILAALGLILAGLLLNIPANSFSSSSPARAANLAPATASSGPTPLPPSQLPLSSLPQSGPAGREPLSGPWIVKMDPHSQGRHRGYPEGRFDGRSVLPPLRT